MSITNLQILREFLLSRNIDLVVGDEETPGDGSCFIHACIQNMVYLESIGQWNRPIPTSSEELRAEVIQFMKERRSYWTRPRFNEETGVMQDAPMEEDDFKDLITDQARERAWTDNNGIFVEALCLYLDIQLDIICPNVGGPILQSGLAGPYLIINKSGSTPRVTFYVGLLKDDQMYNGHYQFLRKKLSRGSNSPSKRASLNSPSPLKLKRSRVIAQYLKSPAKKQLFKVDHCNFCSAIIVTGSELEDHLNKSESCLKYYMRNLKAKSVLSITLKTHNCLFCSLQGSNVRISIHLKKSSDCRDKYFTKFEVSSLKELQGKLEKIKQQLKPSRVNRKGEIKKTREKNKEDEMKKTSCDHINDFKKETSFSNPVQCYKCGANYSLTSAKIEEVELGLEDIDENLKIKRRFERFHCCKECFKVDESRTISLKQMEDEHSILMFPSGSSNSETQLSSSTNKNITCLLPCTVACLEQLDCRNIKSQQQSTGLLYCVEPDLSKLVPIIYENEVYKYKSLKMFGERYEGVISDISSRTLKQAEKVINDSSIVASEAWRRQNSRDYFQRVQQLGSVFIHFTIKVPRESNDILATILIQDNFVVTANFVGDATNEYETQYQVHSHQADQDCSASCRKVPLKDYLDEQGFDFSLIKTKYLSSYATSVQTKFNSFLKNFVKAPSSSLSSDQYYAQLCFHLDNTVDMEGQIWHASLHDINLQIGRGRSSFDTEEKEELIKQVDSLLIATCDTQTLKDWFHISNNEAGKLVKLIMENQYHRCSGCCQGENLNLPLLISSVLEWSPNLPVCQEFKKWILTKLDQLPETQVSVLSTEDWLIQLFSSGEVFGQIDSKNNVLKLEMDQKTFKVKIDHRLSALIDLFGEKYPNQDYTPLIGFYHYSVATASVDEVGGVIIKRPKLKDIYVTEFNVSVLKAFQTKVDMKILNGNGQTSQMNRFRMEALKPHWSVALEIDESIGSTHQEVSLLESLVMFDKKFLRSYSTNPVEYVCAIKNRKTFFKRVKIESDKSFKTENSQHLYEQQMTNIERYFLRSKSEPKLSLCEFVMFYDYCGDAESKELYKLFTQPDVEINDSDKRTAFSANCYLPEILLLQNGDVMKIRNNRKIVAYPRCEPNSPEHFYQKVLLFSPDAEEKMSDVDINVKFCLEDSPPVCDESGDAMTVIKRIERYNFIYFRN